MLHALMQCRHREYLSDLCRVCTQAQGTLGEAMRVRKATAAGARGAAARSAVMYRKRMPPMSCGVGAAGAASGGAGAAQTVMTDYFARRPGNAGGPVDMEV